MNGSSDTDAMKIGAETARQPKRIGGLDGAGWVREIQAKPMVTLPPGAAALVVEYLVTDANRYRQLRQCLGGVFILTCFLPCYEGVSISKSSLDDCLDAITQADKDLNAAFLQKGRKL